MFGWDASKSSTTPWIAADSRSVKKCQNVIVPEAVTPGEAMGLLAWVLGVHAAAPVPHEDHEPAALPAGH